MSVASPCTGVCLVDRHAARCTGCGRSLAQIASWMEMSDAERDGIMRDLAARRAQSEARWGPEPGPQTPGL
jgi:predicted Fe-S protein YdhL (DUF1289 family)